MREYELMEIIVLAALPFEMRTNREGFNARVPFFRELKLRFV